ncbi:S8 family serine peptidase [Streptacidiphilus sp. ASG 303]|uniref:S8 family serine peptidase n=1 Tax=Streptacidiphilus sp. ASG 303 TaxID=2896847 RepID=UPI001E3303B8|nr:S8 family serine peptidase [Streptacidiphilus sp. ASG 303]MCD0485124.1 S8 family serine peptidase [Streptacidiphilus sp. ASG 303]
MRIGARGRVAAVAAAAALLLAGGAGGAAADQVRDAQWPLFKYNAAKDVWPVSQGQGVVVGLIDSGVEAGHQDLTGQILPGADLSGGSSDGRTDELGHGTEMAGLIAGHGHGPGGRDGVMGLAPRAKILPVKVHLAKDTLDLSSQDTRVADAIRYAVDHGAKVINMSLGGAGGGSDERAAVRYAVDHDVVLVASTGNNGFDRVEYPAAVPGVVAVGAVDVRGDVWEKSNRGSEVTLVAPGVHVPHAKNTGPAAYNMGSGTSDATAYVSAVAALVRAKYPQLTAGQVITRLIRSAVAPPDGSSVPNSRYGYGIASPKRALTMDLPSAPKGNPLLDRPESQADPDASATAAAGGDSAARPAADGGGVPPWVPAAGGVVVLAAVVGAVLVVRRRGRGPGGPGGPGGGGPGGHPQPWLPPYQGQQAHPQGQGQVPGRAWGAPQPYGQAYPPQPSQPNPYAQPGLPPQHQSQPHQPQAQPQPNPYQQPDAYRQ